MRLCAASFEEGPVLDEDPTREDDAAVDDFRFLMLLGRARDRRSARARYLSELTFRMQEYATYDRQVRGTGEGRRRSSVRTTSRNP